MFVILQDEHKSKKGLAEVYEVCMLRDLILPLIVILDLD